MDPAPRQYYELPLDSDLGVPVPFACRDSVRRLDRRRLPQCALSRVCGVCGQGLGRPIAFVGTEEERQHNAFHFPPAHLACAERLVAAVQVLDEPVLGQEATPPRWILVTTAGFEYVRPGRTDVDRRPTFEPNSLLPTSSD